MQANRESLLLSLYVDDIIYSSSSVALIDQFKSEMMKTFEMSDQGTMSYFLRLKVKQVSNCIFVMQKNYIENLLQELNMKNCKLVMTSMGVNYRFQGTPTIDFTDPRMYRRLIGKLLYLTRSHSARNLFLSELFI